LFLVSTSVDFDKPFYSFVSAMMQEATVVFLFPLPKVASAERDGEDRGESFGSIDQTPTPLSVVAVYI
jgi:hypothetical protein